MEEPHPPIRPDAPRGNGETASGQVPEPKFVRLPVAVCAFDTEGRIERFDEAAIELLGEAPRPGDEADATKDRVAPDADRAIAPGKSLITEALGTGLPQAHRQMTVERADGTRRMVIASAFPCHDAQAKLTGASLYLTDIKEMRLPADALPSQRAMFETLFESAPDAMLIVGRSSGTIYRINRQAAQMFGYTAAELSGQPIEKLIPERFRAHHAGYHSRYLDDPKVRSMGSGLELFGLRKDGYELPVDVMLGALETDQGVFALTIVRDLSDRRAAEAERQARQAAEATNRARSEFLAKMSHELRSPLNAILGFTRLMAGNPAVATLAGDDLKRVLKSGKHLYALIDQVLDLAKLDAGRATTNETDFDLFLLLEDLRSLFAPEAAAKGLQLEFLRSYELPRFVRADALKLRQILINLVDNAVKFTNQGRVGISAERLAATAEGNLPQLRFEVTDTGPGIAADELATLFQPFSQGKAGLSAGHGTGLGLAISRGFAQLMGGEMHIESTVGVGTTVRFAIPAPSVAGVGGHAAQFRQVSALADDQPRYRMLVVDDQSEARELVARLLEPLGITIKEARNGQEAIDLWRQWHPDVIWMDLAMPTLDGFAAARHIRSSPDGQRPVIIALTVMSGNEERAKALAAGCTDILYKPMRESDIFAALEKHLGARFVYKDPVTAGSASLEGSALHALPAAQRIALEAALLALDTESVDAIVESIGLTDPGLAAVLAEHARDFQYDVILTALRGTGAEGRQDASNTPR